MAIVKHFTKVNFEKDSRHTEAEATYAIVDTPEGACLQIDTYGSKARKIKGKKSQSMRLSPSAMKQLVSIIESNGLLRS